MACSTPSISDAVVPLAPARAMASAIVMLHGDSATFPLAAPAFARNSASPISSTDSAPAVASDASYDARFSDERASATLPPDPKPEPHEAATISSTAAAAHRVRIVILTPSGGGGR